MSHIKVPGSTVKIPMTKEMLVNVSEGEECRIALLEDGRLEELYMERTSSVSHVGNVYRGRVSNVEPSIQAAFIDFGIGRNGFLHIQDLMPTYFGRRGENVRETVGRKLGRRDRPPIQQCLRRGDEIIVQIIKEGIGTKGPTLTSYVSIPGRILVMMPGVGKSGVSRKIEDPDERRRLRKILDELVPPKDLGFIIRTAGIGKSKVEIERDLKYLLRLWETIEQAQDGSGPAELYAEGDLVMRTVRDVYTPDIDRIVVDSPDVAKRIKDFFKLMMPRTKNKVEIYNEPTPIFHKYNIETAIEQMHSRRVPLPSGGSLIIDQTEAVVAIDVNSGKFREHSDAETTAFQTDLEAADEIPRQLRLRDLGGVVICDFIDLRFERHRRLLEERLAENLKKDRAKTRFLQMSEFGIIEMTRQRMRPSLKRSIYHDCPHCLGTGLVKTSESIGLDAVRKLALAAADERVAKIELHLSHDAALHVLNRKRATISDIEKKAGKPIKIVTDSKLAVDELKFVLTDDREANVYLDVLGMAPEAKDDKPSGRGKRRGRGRDRDRRRDDRGDREDSPANIRDEFERDEEGNSTRDGPRHEQQDDRDDLDAGTDSHASEPENKPADEPSSQEQSDGGHRRRRRRGARGRDGESPVVKQAGAVAIVKTNARGERVYESAGEYDIDPRDLAAETDERQARESSPDAPRGEQGIARHGSGQGSAPRKNREHGRDERPHDDRPAKPQIPVRRIPFKVRRDGGPVPAGQATSERRQPIVYPQLGDFKPQPIALRGPKIVRDDGDEPPPQSGAESTEPVAEVESTVEGKAPSVESTVVDEGDRPRRKRRRRGRRGRVRTLGREDSPDDAPNAVGADRDTQADEFCAPVDEEPVADDQTEPEVDIEIDNDPVKADTQDAAKSIGSRRAKSAVRRKSPENSSENSPEESAPKKESKPRRDRKSSRVTQDKQIELPPIIPTGSSDRHYVQSEQMELPPVNFGSMGFGDLDVVRDDDDDLED